MKKIISLILVSLILMTSCFTAFAISEEEIKAKSAILMEAETGEILYEKNSHEPRSAASITKVMTMLLVMESIDSDKIKLSDIVTASAHASSMGGSQIWLKEGEQMTVEELIKATMVASANDAATALAEFIAGSESEFVTIMNQKAKDLGMNDTLFVNSNGLDEGDQHTSAHDVAVMSSELIKHEKIKEYSLIWMEYLRDGATELVNTNKLIKTYPGITGLKTGTTDKAGNCVVSTAERDDMKLVAVVLGAETGKTKFEEAAKLMDYGFANFGIYNPDLLNVKISPVSVINGMEKEIQGEVQGRQISDKVLVPHGKEQNVNMEIKLDEAVEAPIEKNQIIGKIEISLDGKMISEYKIGATKSIGKITFSSAFSKLIEDLFKNGCK